MLVLKDDRCLDRDNVIFSYDDPNCQEWQSGRCINCQPGWGFAGLGICQQAASAPALVNPVPTVSYPTKGANPQGVTVVNHIFGNEYPPRKSVSVTQTLTNQAYPTSSVNIVQNNGGYVSTATSSLTGASQSLAVGGSGGSGVGSYIRPTIGKTSVTVSSSSGYSNPAATRGVGSTATGGQASAFGGISGSSLIGGPSATPGIGIGGR